MQGKDHVEQNISDANRCKSVADGPNLLQSAATARMNQIDRCNSRDPMEPMADWAAEMSDYRTRDNFDRHFRMPGGMTFRAGSILPGDK
jgi:hypothetical protein